MKHAGSIRTRTTLAFAALLSAVACGAEEVEDVPPEVVRFTVDRTSVAAGERVTLSWEVKGDVRVTVSQGETKLVDGQPQLQGSVESGPVDGTTTFQLVARDGGGRQATGEVRVEVTGLRIVRFEAEPSTILLGASSRLVWQTGGQAPISVRVVDGGGNRLYDGADPQGVVDVSPREDERYTLTVVGASGTLTAEATVTVDDTMAAPRIVSFTAVSQTVAVGAFAQLNWVVEDAREVQITQNGRVVRPWTSNGATMGAVQREITEPETTFLLEARRDAARVVSATLMVTGRAVPRIQRFEVTPAEYAQATTTATVRWETSDADTVTLELDNRAVADFPSQASGTFQLPISGEPTLRLRARSNVDEATQTAMIRFGYDDLEPNDTSSTAIALSGDGSPFRGTVSGSGDVDVYAVMVPEGGRISAQVSLTGQGGCTFDGTLTLTGPGGQVLGNGVPSPDRPPCPFIHPLLHGFADGLPAGVYYLTLAAPAPAAGGRYALSVRVGGATPELAGVSLTEVGSPLWHLTDLHQFAADLGDQFDDVGPVLDELLVPHHELLGFMQGAVTAIYAPGVAHTRAYETELAAGASAAGRAQSSTFTAADLSGFRGLLLGFTVVPSAGAPVGSSVDSGNGPIIPFTAFPLRVTLELRRNGVLWGGAATPFDLRGYNDWYPGAPPIANPGTGASHLHLASIANATVFGAMAQTGSYLWVMSLTDASGAGWRLEVPFTVQ